MTHPAQLSDNAITGMAIGAVFLVLYIKFRIIRWIIRGIAGPSLSKPRASVIALLVMAFLGGRKSDSD
jgi:hypothetical protein